MYFFKRITALKKLVLLFLFAELLNFQGNANPGDTTWVTVYNLKKLTYYGNYDTTAIYPTGKRYRKIRLHYILGRYACPGNPQYCGSWDYTTDIYARPANNDSVEIARVITPYASDWLTLGRTHEYIVDVTDYAPVLEGPTAMRFKYEGYSWGFTITLKIEFIEGVPAMDAQKIKNVYSGYFPFGNSSNTIENYLVPKTFSYSPTTGRVFLKNTVSGHGSDNTNCAEFCNKWYQLKVNNNMVAQRQLWRNDCGENQVYPQTGTWIYERGNWCPGAVVWPVYHDLSSLTTANNNFSVNIDMQPYSGNGNAGYNYQTQLIYYTAPNHTRDVSIEDIIGPTSDDNWFRQNPRCANPLIRIRNAGTDSVKSVAFTYGLKGGATGTYTWTGALGYLDTTVVFIPFASAVIATSVNAVFQVSVVSVNTLPADDNLFNNIYRSDIPPMVIFPKNIVVRLLTNFVPSDNEWTIYDEFDTPTYSNGPLTAATFHRDTILNIFPGCYRFTIKDYSCDGLSWWANNAAGHGSLRFEKTNTNGTVYTCPVDFGCSFTKYFTVLPDPAPPPPPPPPVDTTAISTYADEINDIEVFPNPASTSAYIVIDVKRKQNMQYKISDVNGRLISQKSLTGIAEAYETIDLSGIESGVYFVKIILEDHSSVTRKLVVQK
jgi:hypothetical protein